MSRPTEWWTDPVPHAIWWDEDMHLMPNHEYVPSGRNGDSALKCVKCGRSLSYPIHGTTLGPSDREVDATVVGLKKLMEKLS